MRLSVFNSTVAKNTLSYGLVMREGGFYVVNNAHSYQRGFKFDYLPTYFIDDEHVT